MIMLRDERIGSFKSKETIQDEQIVKDGLED